MERPEKERDRKMGVIGVNSKQGKSSFNVHPSNESKHMIPEQAICL